MHLKALYFNNSNNAFFNCVKRLKKFYNFLSVKTFVTFSTNQRICRIRNFEVWLWMLPLFCLTSQLQRLVKFFLSIKYICLRYLKCSPTSGLSNASTLDVLRHVDMILKHVGGFSNNPPKFQKKPNSPFKGNIAPDFWKSKKN